MDLPGTLRGYQRTLETMLRWPKICYHWPRHVLGHAWSVSPTAIRRHRHGSSRGDRGRGSWCDSGTGAAYHPWQARPWVMPIAPQRLRPQRSPWPQEDTTHDIINNAHSASEVSDDDDDVLSSVVTDTSNTPAMILRPQLSQSGIHITVPSQAVIPDNPTIKDLMSVIISNHTETTATLQNTGARLQDFEAPLYIAHSGASKNESDIKSYKRRTTALRNPWKNWPLNFVRCTMMWWLSSSLLQASTYPSQDGIIMQLCIISRGVPVVNCSRK